MITSAYSHYDNITGIILLNNIVGYGHNYIIYYIDGSLVRIVCV